MTLLDFLELHLFKDEYAEAEYQEAKHLGLLNSWADKVNKLAGTKSFYSYAIFNSFGEPFITRTKLAFNK